MMSFLKANQGLELSKSINTTGATVGQRATSKCNVMCLVFCKSFALAGVATVLDDILTYRNHISHPFKRVTVAFFSLSRLKIDHDPYL